MRRGSQARVKLENWLYWICIDSVLGFLFGSPGLYLYALLSVVYLGVSAVGFMRWLKTYRTSAARELMLAEALAHVPGYIPGESRHRDGPSCSGGSVNRSYEVSTPAGRFVSAAESGAGCLAHVGSVRRAGAASDRGRGAALRRGSLQRTG